MTSTIQTAQQISDPIPDIKQRVAREHLDVPNVHKSVSSNSVDPFASATTSIEHMCQETLSSSFATDCTITTANVDDLNKTKTLHKKRKAPVVMSDNEHALKV